MPFWRAIKGLVIISDQPDDGDIQQLPVSVENEKPKVIESAPLEEEDFDPFESHRRSKLQL